MFVSMFFEMTVETNELAKELMNKKLQHIIVLWSGGENMNPCFQQIFCMPIISLGW
jgi:hypothetical protein